MSCWNAAVEYVVVAAETSSVPFERTSIVLSVASSTPPAIAVARQLI